MKKETFFVTGLVLVFLCGCEGFRYPATEAQKQNAWLHLRTTQLVSDQAGAESASSDLQGLAALAYEQSQAFAADYGMPAEIPSRSDAEAIVARAQADSVRRLDPWTAADGLLELGIGLVSLLGGGLGLKVVGILKQARQKTRALKEIIRGNEVFKQLHTHSAEAFKEAQENQSPATRRLVTELKAAG